MSSISEFGPEPSFVDLTADRPTCSLCHHFKMSRMDLFQVIKIKKLRDFPTVMRIAGSSAESQGCEICKPAVQSILSSIYNEHVMKPMHNSNQETNDK